MCTSSQIIGSLLVLSVLEIGLGVSSVAVGAVSFSLVLTEHKPQLGDSSPNSPVHDEETAKRCFKLMSRVCQLSPEFLEEK